MTTHTYNARLSYFLRSMCRRGRGPRGGHDAWNQENHENRQQCPRKTETGRQISPSSSRRKSAIDRRHQRPTPVRCATANSSLTWFSLPRNKTPPSNRHPKPTPPQSNNPPPPPFNISPPHKHHPESTYNNQPYSLHKHYTNTYKYRKNTTATNATNTTNTNTNSTNTKTDTDRK